MNKTQVVYVGNRAKVCKEWKQKRYTFVRSKAVYVPDDFATALLSSADFVTSDAVSIPVTNRFPLETPLVFRRWGAMGDLLMFRAAVAAFKRDFDYPVMLRCHEQYRSIFDHDPLWTRVGAAAGDFEGAEAVVSFDQVAEADHMGMNQYHRVELFMRSMSHQPLVVKPEDWRIPVDKKTEQWIEQFMYTRRLTREQRSHPLIALQIRGSGPMKSLPQNQMLELVKMMVKAKWNVLLIESESVVTKKFKIDPLVHELCHRDALHTIEAMRHVNLAVTMDSGALWMTHCAPCPVLAILGPTRPEQRLTMHPMYPKSARSVCLNEIINCPPCFEAAEACKKSFKCMQAQPDWKVALNQIIDGVRGMLRGDVPLPVAAPVAAVAASNEV